ncbi:SGNH/GDSL hydrolase family protein [Companilactobacillus nodensis]|uniref:Lysophospholipase L1-like esterase n=1 Tax=Companilactobacillus nodensis DSM 19682 = JCM 14932 = NBRC 107160 TaxID=1423775 RepID=A0A0R1K6J8_9LACO|nr:SGNH/GDSL hydrolase family protein [Companilactobacillus nodensis]KRK78888.1 lysophospholipase L1-like esterase [Companilactobacillus nodensis DSM 19682 = JCM 14932 = NBRC 107160]
MWKKKVLLSVLMILLAMSAAACTQQKNNSNNTDTKIEKKQSKSNNKKPSVKKNASKTILSELKNSNQKSLTYYALGDSLSVGLFSNTEQTRFTSLFANDLRKGTGKKVTEDNNSSVGKTVTNFGLPNVQNLITANPDIVTIEFGTNDSAYGVDAKNLGDFVTNMDSVVRQVKSQTNAKILLMTTWSPSDGKYISNDAVYDREIKRIGNKYGVPVVDLSMIWRNNPSVTENDLGYSKVYNIQKDNFHPNQLGHDKIAKLLYETVKNQEVK